MCSLSLCDLVEKSDDNYLRLTPNEKTALGKVCQNKMENAFENTAEAFVIKYEKFVFDSLEFLCVPI